MTSIHGEAEPRRSPRRRARESALAALFAEEFGSVPDARVPEALADLIGDDASTGEGLTGYASTLVEGVRAHRDAIDEHIRATSHHWRIERMSLIDRNILRIGVYEILYIDDMTPAVAINEAVEIARRFGDTESFSFVNGVLDAVAKAGKPGELDV